MKQTFFMLLCSVLISNSLGAQVINFEDTWQEFLAKEKTSNISKLPKPAKEETSDYLKYCLMYANSHFCAGELGAAEGFMTEIKKLGAAKYEPIPNFKAKYDDLTKKMADGLKVEKLWKTFVTDHRVSLDEIAALADAKRVCTKGILSKLFYMETYAHYCVGDYAKAKENFEGRVLQLTEKTSFDAKTVKGLPEEIAMMKSLLAGLEKLDVAWNQFMSTQVSPGFETELPPTGCNVVPALKAYTLRAYVDLCKYGPAMYAKMKPLLANNKNPLPADLDEKVKHIEKEVGNSAAELADLNAAWKEFVPKDTLLKAITDYKLVPFYCDKPAQIKSWVLKGMKDQCALGQLYLDSINALQKANPSLVLDAELSCRVLRLRGRVWDCRYWELVARARKETHEERERFGPESAGIMQVDLNGKGVVCPTTVKYEPLGYIGIKYTITVSLCQAIDVAKMGDPEYYKKIVSWVNNQVLVKYCHSANMRCKEDFYVYIEGHTDGNAFSGADYKESLGIPKGTPFTHYVVPTLPKGSPKGTPVPTKVDTLQKVTDREITKDLKNNMELGLARAWSIKQQLDFIKVPIKVGAYEHPPKEKTSEFRRIETQLFMTNLLLDFYEKRLQELIIESGIGERPKPC